MLSLKRRIDCLISLLLVASMPVMAEEPLSPLPQLPAESATIVNKERTWNLQDADIKTVVEQVSRETGKNFILDPKVSGTISIISNQPISPDEVYQVFLAALQVLGFAAVDEGSVIKIVPDASAKFLIPQLVLVLVIRWKCELFPYNL